MRRARSPEISNGPPFVSPMKATPTILGKTLRFGQINPVVPPLFAVRVGVNLGPPGGHRAALPTPVPPSMQEKQIKRNAHGSALHDPRFITPRLEDRACVGRGP